MSIAPRRRLRLLLVIVGAVGVVGIGAAVLVKATVLRDRSRAVSIDVARDRYRSAVTDGARTSGDGASTTVRAVAPETGTGDPTTSAPPSEAPPQAIPRLVERGVYRYRTSGQEAIDVLGGATHHYPAETTVTATPDGCGILLRWEPLVERHDEWELCATPSGIEVQKTGLQYHEFFRTADPDRMACDRTVVVVPAPGDAPPSPQQQVCMLADDPWLPSWEVLEQSQRTVGGQPVEVRHVRMTIEDDDEYWEHTVIDWYLASDGLPVEVVARKESRSPSPIGGVVYEESYHLELVSLLPLT